MTITKKPSRPARATKDKDAVAQEFIQAADHSADAKPSAPSKKPAVKKAPKAKKVVTKSAASAPKSAAAPVAPPAKEKKTKDKAKDKGKKKKGKKKEAVIIRFEDAQLGQIDTSAEALGLSRAAWVRMVVARALTKA
jgi:hypothetical protein